MQLVQLLSDPSCWFFHEKTRLESMEGLGIHLAWSRSFESVGLLRLGFPFRGQNLYSATMLDTRGNLLTIDFLILLLGAVITANWN